MHHYPADKHSTERAKSAVCHDSGAILAAQNRKARRLPNVSASVEFFFWTGREEGLRSVRNLSIQLQETLWFAGPQQSTVAKNPQEQMSATKFARTVAVSYTNSLNCRTVKPVRSTSSQCVETLWHQSELLEKKLLVEASLLTIHEIPTWHINAPTVWSLLLCCKGCIIFYDTLPAYCIPKAIMMETGEISYTRKYLRHLDLLRRFPLKTAG